LTDHTNEEIRVAAVYTIKNLLFRCTKEMKISIMKEVTYHRLNSLIVNEENVVI
jgi:hypothetical protein